MKYYAVKRGRQAGIYLSWKECEEQIKGFSGAVYKSFTSLDQAKEYIKEVKEKPLTGQGLVAYVDGSYNIKTKEYGYGCVLLEGQTVILETKGNGKDEDMASMRNVAGEIIGSEVAIQYAIDKGYDYICVYYDYEGIEKWANHEWKANKKGTQAYQKFIDVARTKIHVKFIKVLAHSGDYYNEKADQLAKASVGIK